MTKTMQELNYLAGCRFPDTPEGRALLHRVYCAHVEELPNYEDRQVGLYELAEAAVPIATQEQWTAFADLGGWMVDVDDVMGNEGTPAERMRIALCMIADTLMAGLEAEHIKEQGKVTA